MADVRRDSDWIDYFFLGHYATLLECCVKTLRVKFLASDKGTKDKIWMLRVKQNEIEHFCERFFVELRMLDNLEDAKNRWCELARMYFTIHLLFDEATSGLEDDEVDDYEREHRRFVRAEFKRLYKQENSSAGSGCLLRLSVELPPPSGDWFDPPGAAFEIVEAEMNSLLDICVLEELDFTEISCLGSCSDMLKFYVDLYSRCTQPAPATAEENDKQENAQNAKRFWMEFAASMLANQVAIDRERLRAPP